MITNNLLHLHMTEKSIMLSIVETAEGMEVHINEKAYGNFGLVGLIEQIKLNLLSDSEIKSERKEKISESTSQRYDA